MSSSSSPLLPGAQNIHPQQGTWLQKRRRLFLHGFANQSCMVYDWVLFTIKWVFSWLFFGTVLSIKNESDEPVTLYIKTSFSSVTGFGDWTWNLYRDGWTVIPEKALLWRTEPRRRHTFMLPFCTCLIVLGTEANFTHFLVHDANAPGDRFATIWTSSHSFVPRFVTVNRNFQVITLLSCGQANPTKPRMGEAFKQCTLFAIYVDQNKFPKVLLPKGVRIVIGPSLALPQDLQQQERASLLNLGMIVRATDLVNEATAFAEFFTVHTLTRRLIVIYLFLQIEIGNSMKFLKSPLPQGLYGENSFWLGADYDASLAFVLQAFPGGLQAILILVITRPDSGIQLVSVLLACANLIMIAAAICSSFSERVLNHMKFFNYDRKTKYLLVFIPCMVFFAVPFSTFVIHEYYRSDQSDITVYVVVAIVFVFAHSRQIANTHQMDAAIGGITPLEFLRFLRKVVGVIAKFIYRYGIESFIAILMLTAVIINIILLFVVKE